MTQDDNLSFPPSAFDILSASFAIESHVAAALNALPRIEFTIPPIHVDVSALQTILEEQSKALEALQQAFHDNIAVAGEQAARTFNELSTRFREALEKAEAIGEYGWTFSKDAPLPDMFYIVEAAKDKASADAAFLWYFTKDDEGNLKRLIQGTLANRDLENWKPKLQDALACFHEGKYWACTTLLSPVVEAVCVQRFSQDHFHSRDKREQFFNDRLKSLSNDSISQLSWRCFIAFMRSFLKYEPFGKGRLEPTVLNRNWLLHGRAATEPKREDCLRLLQVLETITDLTI